jgi:cell fate regulator YaaT (PSP1 superfamily)
LADETQGPPQDTTGQASPDPQSSPETEAKPEPAPAERGQDEKGSSDAAPAETQSPPEKGKAGPPTVVVRYGAMGYLGKFTHHLDQVQCGRQLVIKSDRGQEIGTLVGACPGGQCHETVPDKTKGEVLRVATHTDEIEARHLHESEEREAAFCRERIAARNLPMKLVKVEHLFGGDRVVFYFVAEKRVDFRALVRDLAREFQTRIEMRQVGVRDEARLLGDQERCGRPLCCRTWIKSLSPVSMKMAKVQKATLDPAKISGQCGRLMCCLRFEHSTYEQMKKALPRRNSYVRCQEGVGKVVDTDVVTQIVSVQLSEGTRIAVPLESILERNVDPGEVKSQRGSKGGSAKGQGSRRAGQGGDKSGRGDKASGAKKDDDSGKGDAKDAGSKKGNGSGRSKSKRRRSRRRSKRRGSKSASGKGKSGGGSKSKGDSGGS